MKLTTKLFTSLLLITFVLFLTLGCAEEAAAPESEPEPEVTLDRDEVLMEAAQAYFPRVAQSNNMLPSENVKAMLEDNPDQIVIIDMRSAEDFEEGHIDSAYHSSWGEIGNIMDRIPRNRQVVIACYSGQTSGQAVGALRLAGFDNVQSLFYGMNLGWRDRAGFERDGSGPNPATGLSSVSAPRNEKEEILWQAVQEYFAKIPTEGNKMLPGQDLYDALQTNPNAFHVVDIRGADNYAEGHVEFSTHTPWTQFGDILPDLSRNRPIVVTCFSGQTSGQTVGILRSMGYDAYSLFYGVRDGWVNRAALPLVSAE